MQRYNDWKARRQEAKQIKKLLKDLGFDETEVMNNLAKYDNNSDGVRFETCPVVQYFRERGMRVLIGTTYAYGNCATVELPEPVQQAIIELDERRYRLKIRPVN